LFTPRTFSYFFILAFVLFSASLQLSGFALPRFPLTNLAPIPQSAESALPVESGLSIANSPLFAIIGDQPDVVESYELESMVKRRRKKMHRHKYRKRLRKERNLEK
jgi:hypothetical protein